MNFFRNSNGDAKAGPVPWSKTLVQWLSGWGVGGGEGVRGRWGPLHNTNGRFEPEKDTNLPIREEETAEAAELVELWQVPVNEFGVHECGRRSTKVLTVGTGQFWTVAM